MAPKDILPGEDWDRALGRAIREADLFLARLTQRSVTKRGVFRKEIQQALDEWRQKLIDEIYTFLKQADARELRHIFVELDEARANGAAVDEIIDRIDNFQTHVVPIIADIDAGFGNEEATYLLAKKMIEAGACAIQVENQVSDAKQCGHQAGKVTVPHEDFLSKINAIRYAFLELGIENGIIVARTDSLGASLTQKIPVSKGAGDLTGLVSTLHSSWQCR